MLNSYKVPSNGLLINNLSGIMRMAGMVTLPDTKKTNSFLNL